MAGDLLKGKLSKKVQKKCIHLVWTSGEIRKVDYSI
jgi:hypothetical protein